MIIGSMNKYRFLACLMVLTACEFSNLPFQNEGTTLLQTSKQLNCTEKRYEFTIDSLWDVVSTRLEKVLPDTMPPGRRENMIKIRNATLLKQFKIFYTTLDTASLNLIGRSGNIDSLTALKVMALKEQREAHERKVLDFLIQVEKEDPRASKKWNEKFLKALKEDCR
jgi:hypothetical protein